MAGTSCRPDIPGPGSVKVALAPIVVLTAFGLRGAVIAPTIVATLVTVMVLLSVPLPVSLSVASRVTT